MKNSSRHNLIRVGFIIVVTSLLHYCLGPQSVERFKTPSNIIKSPKVNVAKKIPAKHFRVKSKSSTKSDEVVVPDEKRLVYGTPIETAPKGESIPLMFKIYLNKRYLGEDQVRVFPGQLIVIDKFYAKVLLNRFQKRLTDEEMERLKNILQGVLTIGLEDLESLGIKCEFDVSDGSIYITIPDTWLKPTLLSFEIEAEDGLTPNRGSAPFSGYVNAVATRNYPDLRNSKISIDYLGLRGVFSAGGFSMHSGVDIDQTARRTESAIVIPWDNGKSQLWLGDARYDINGAAQVPDLTGIAFYRKHANNSFDADLDAGTFEIRNKSRVQIFKNDTLLRSFESQPGKFTLNDIPLSSGDNLIRIVIHDSVTGEVTEKSFNDYLPIMTLPKGELDYSMAYGLQRSNGLSQEIVYDTASTFSSALMYGVTRYNSSGGQLIARKNHLKVTAQTNFNTSYGGFSGLVTESTKTNADSSRGYKGTIRYTKVFDDSWLNSLTVSGSSFDANYTETADSAASVDGGSDSSFTFSLAPILKLGISAGVTSLQQNGTTKNSYFTDLSRHFSINRNLNAQLSAGQSFSETGNSTRFLFTLTFNDFFEGGSFRARETENQNRSSTSLNYQKGDYLFSLGSSASRHKDARVSSAGVIRRFDRAIISGNYSYAGDTRSSFTGKLETAIAFTNNTYAWTRPLSNSFIIFESVLSGAEYEITDKNGKVIATSGSELQTYVMPVQNYSTSYFGSSFVDPQYFTLESSEATIYSSGFRTGTDVILSSDVNTYVMVIAQNEVGELIRNAQGKLDCKEKGASLTNSIFTNENGETNFFVRRNSNCQLKFDTLTSDTLDLSWPTKFRDLGIIQLK